MGFFKKIALFFASLVTDTDWDGDAAKFCGLAILIAGIVGFFLEKDEFQWVIGFGAARIGTGKWSEERKR